MSIRLLNPNAEVLNKSAALHMNINAAKGLQDVLKSNLGPKGTIKMLVGDDISGDGTTSTIAKRATLQFLEKFKTPVVMGDEPDREILKMVARTALRTKLHEALADQLTDIVVNSVLCIRKPELGEIMHMRHKFDVDTRLVQGLVLDHGSRHPDMKRRAENCFILTGNVSLEYEKSEINAGFFYSNAEQREAMVIAERRQVDERVQKIIELKNKVCSGTDNNFVAVNSVESLTPDCLGWAGLVYEHILGEEKYTFVENVKNPHSCTILIKGPNDHTIAQIKDAVRAFEFAARKHLINEVKKTVKGRAQLGVEAFADALLVVPKTLAENSGLDTQDEIVTLTGEHDRDNIVGLNLQTGGPLDPQMEGIFDNYSVKRQLINSGPVIASQLLLVDEVIRAGRNMRKPT
uniref:Uncharacterized protein n=1 Tax=Salix viminalis TaxID=40686 RepID=A0A6N2L5Q5_SALVM